jgi:hypothetical protein
VNLVRITGNTVAIGSLEAVDGLELVRASVAPLGPDQWEISGYATDVAIPAIEGLGAEVKVIQSDSDAQAENDLVAQTTQQAIAETGEAEA